MTEAAVFEVQVRLDEEQRKLVQLQNLEITAISLKSQLRALEQTVYPSPETYEAIDAIIDDAAYFGKSANYFVQIYSNQINTLKENTTNV
jgi:hypothetical protein